MPVPTTITDLSATASANSPAGADPIGTLADDYIRSHAAILRNLYDDILAGNVSLVPSGTIMLFQQTSAPTSWTKLATHNDKCLRVVSGTVGSGGANSFTTVFGAGKATASHTLSTAEIPAHNHGVTDTGHGHGVSDPTHSHGVTDPQHHHGISLYNTGAGGSEPQIAGGSVNGPSINGTLPASTGVTVNSASTGLTVASGVTGISIANAGGGGGHTHGLTLDLQYVDVILASKN